MPRVVSNILLSHVTNNNYKTLQFSYAYKKLGLKNNLAVRINREKSGSYIYKYPGYFLNLKELVHALSLLIQNKSLTLGIIEKYLHANLSFINVAKYPRPYYFRLMGKLLTVNGLIEDTKMTGEELRVFLNKHVSDGPICRIMDITDWQEDIDSMIAFAKNQN